MGVTLCTPSSTRFVLAPIIGPCIQLKDSRAIESNHNQNNAVDVLSTTENLDNPPSEQEPKLKVSEKIWWKEQSKLLMNSTQKVDDLQISHTVKDIAQKAMEKSKNTSNIQTVVTTITGESEEFGSTDPDVIPATLDFLETLGMIPHPPSAKPQTSRFKKFPFGSGNDGLLPSAIMSASGLMLKTATGNARPSMLPPLPPPLGDSFDYNDGQMIIEDLGVVGNTVKPGKWSSDDEDLGNSSSSTRKAAVRKRRLVTPSVVRRNGKNLQRLKTVELEMSDSLFIIHQMREKPEARKSSPSEMVRTVSSDIFVVDGPDGETGTVSYKLECSQEF